MSVVEQTICLERWPTPPALLPLLRGDWHWRRVLARLLDDGGWPVVAPILACEGPESDAFARAVLARVGTFGCAQCGARLLEAGRHVRFCNQQCFLARKRTIKRSRRYARGV